MHIVTLGLGIVDLIAALLILTNVNQAYLLYLGVFMLAKGGFFLFTSFAGKSMSLHCTVLCVSDLMVGTTLLMIGMAYATPGTAGMVSTVLRTIGIIGVVKGLYTSGFSLMG